MSANTVRLVACRTYGVLVVALGVFIALFSLVLFYWSAYGAPADILAELAKQNFPFDISHFLAGLGGGMLVFAVLAIAGGVFAILGRIWPLIAGTVIWALLISPRLFTAGTNSNTKSDLVVLIVLSALTLVGLLAGKRASHTPRLFAR